MNLKKNASFKEGSIRALHIVLRILKYFTHYALIFLLNFFMAGTRGQLPFSPHILKNTHKSLITTFVSVPSFLSFTSKGINGLSYSYN